MISKSQELLARIILQMVNDKRLMDSDKVHSVRNICQTFIQVAAEQQAQAMEGTPQQPL